MVPIRGEATCAPTNGAVETILEFDRNEALLVSPEAVTLVDGRTKIQVSKPYNHTCTLHISVAVANFKAMAPHQAVNTKPLPRAQVLLVNNPPGECEHILNQMFHDKNETDAKRWYPTPETCDDPTLLNKAERSIYDEIITLRGKEHLNPTENDAQRKKFL